MAGAAPWWLCTPLHYPPPAPEILPTLHCQPPCKCHRRRKPPSEKKLSARDYRKYVRALKRADRARRYALWERYEMMRLAAGDMLGNGYYGWGDWDGDEEPSGWRKDVLEAWDDMHRETVAKKEKEKREKKEKKEKKFQGLNGGNEFHFKNLHIHLNSS